MFNRIIDKLYEGDCWGIDPVPLESLEPSHISGIINWLINHAESLKFSYELDFLSFPTPGGEQASIEYDLGFNELLSQSASEWLEETPLMINLRKLESKYMGL